MTPTSQTKAPNPTITLQFSQEFYDRFVNKLVMALYGSPEEVLMFLVGQAMEAPVPAQQWMVAKRLFDVRAGEGHPPPTAKNVYEACADAARDRALNDNQVAINLASAVRACCS